MPAESEGTEAVSESCCINTRVGCQPPAAETHCVPIFLSLSLPLASAFALTLSYSLTLWVGWLWVAGSYATGIDIPGGQTVNSRLVRTESVVGLHNMVVPLFHPPPPPTIPPAPPTSSARGYERRTLPPGRRVSSCKVVATFWD